MLSHMIKIKPLSVNAAWQGKRFKTQAYKDYENVIGFLLPEATISSNKHYTLDIKFGFSNAASDIDNPVKPFLDVLQKKYHFNDKNIYKLNIEKEIVAKGKEFIKFKMY